MNRTCAASRVACAGFALAVATGAIAPAASTPAPADPAARDSAATDSAAAPDSVLDLGWLERAVLERNRDLAAMREAQRAAEAHAARSGALDDPMLDAEVAPQSLGRDPAMPGYAFRVSQRLPLFGQRGLMRREAGGEARVAALEFERARLDLLRETRDAYFDLYRVARAARVNRDLTQLLAELHHVALAHYAAGTAMQADPLEAEVERAMLSHEAAVIERERRVLVARLNALLHRPMDAVLPMPPRGLAVPDSPVTAEWIEARSRAPWPELRAAEAEVETKRASLALARRARWPETSFNVGYNRMWPEPEMRTTVGMSLGLPLHLARLSDAEREARAGLAAAEARRDAARDRVERDLEIAAAGFAESRHEVDVMQLDVVPASERLLAARRSAYESGRGDFLALIGAVRNLHRARLDVDEAVTAALRAHAELRRALAVDAAPAPGGER